MTGDCLDTNSTIYTIGLSCDDGDPYTTADSVIASGASCTCVGVSVCGDNYIRGDETCDDGNTDNYDGCSSSCEIESRFDCTGEPSVCTSNQSCGDGSLVVPELDTSSHGFADSTM